MKYFFPFISIFLISCAGKFNDRTPDDFFKVIIGAQKDSDIIPCSDYGSRRNYQGEPYYLKLDRQITRHEGIDFCTRAGAEVIAPTNGIISNLVRTDPLVGGRVIILSKIKQPISLGKDVVQTNLHFSVVHIFPSDDLKEGSLVTAGQTIGRTEPPGKYAIGSRSHVHLEAHTSPFNWGQHTDPNQFWQKGPGVISCFDPNNPPLDSQIVAPVRCKSK